MIPLPGGLDVKSPMSQSPIYPVQRFLFTAIYIKHK